jgi:hypothetical protein
VPSKPGRAADVRRRIPHREWPQNVRLLFLDGYEFPFFWLTRPATPGQLDSGRCGRSVHDHAVERSACGGATLLPLGPTPR